jgi:hypothetical protein
LSAIKCESPENFNKPKASARTQPQLKLKIKMKGATLPPKVAEEEKDTGAASGQPRKDEARRSKRVTRGIGK